MLPTLFPVHLFTIKKVKNRPWNTSNTWLKFSKTKGIFFRINCGISGQQYREHQLCYGYKFRRWVSYAKDKNNVRTFEQKVISAPVCFVWANTYSYMPLVWAAIHCGSKMEKHDFEANESWWEDSNCRTG